MSFLVKQPALPQGATALDPKLASGYKAAEIVPQGWGRDVYPSKWVSPKYDEHEQDAGSNKPAFQYCSIAARYCRGPIDFVGKLFYNGEEITNFDYTFSPGEESHTFTINPSMASGKAWQAIVHRGTEDAPTSGVTNLNAKTGQNHPPMRGYCWVEWINIDLGAGTTALPSLALELGTHAPEIGDFPGGDSHPYGVNAFAACHALLTTATGGDFDAGLLDDDHWGDQCLALEATGVGNRTGNLVHCHPSFTASTSLGDALSQILSYVDGYLYARGGQLRVGWFPSQAVDAGSLPEITEHDLAAVPGGGGFADPNEGATSAVVVFKSFDKNYGEDAARVNAPANRESAFSAEPVVKQRPFIHASDQAAEIAVEIASDAAGEDTTVNLTVLKSRAVNGAAPLMPGDLVNWDYAPHGIDLVCRVIARRMRTGTASDVLTIMRERGAYPRPYVAPVDERVLPAADDPGEIDPADVRSWFVPSLLSDGIRSVVHLINRTKRSIYRAEIYLSPDGAAPWELLIDQRFFVAKGEVVTAGINASATTVRVESTSVDFERMAAQNAVGQDNDDLLALIDDELVSIGDITSVSTDVYDLAILRGRQGTTAAAHTVADIVWIFYRSELRDFLATHWEFENVRNGSGVYDTTIATKYFKIALFTLRGADGVAKPDDPGLSLQLPDVCPPPTSFDAANAPFLQEDGTTDPRVGLTWVSPASTHVVAKGQLRWEYKGSADSAWLPGGMMTADKTLAYALDVLIGNEYDFRIRSEVDGFVSAWAEKLNFEVEGDTTAPVALTGVTATPYGGFNRIEWPASAEADISEYKVQRATNSGFSSGLVTLTEGTTETFWDDTTAVPGTTYFYRVYPIDASNNQQPTASNTASCTTAALPVTDVAPTAPSAASKVGGSDTVYADGQGTLFVKIQLSVPAKPANAVRVEVLLGTVNDATKAKAIIQIKESSTATPWVDDLIAGNTYYLWTRTWSLTQASAAVAVTSSPFTITTGAAPSAPSAVTISGLAADLAGAPPRFTTTGGKMGVMKVTWTPPSDANQGAYYELETDYLVGAPGPEDDLFIRTKGTETFAFVYFGVGGASSLITRVRLVGKNAQPSSYSSYSSIGGVSASYGTANMAEQAKTAVAITGGAVDVATLKRSGTDVVVTTRTVNGYALSSNVTLAKADVGLGSVPNTDATNASNISSGTLANARLPASIERSNFKAGASAYNNQAGDIGVSRDAAPTTGYVYLGSGGNNAIGFDGTKVVVIVGGVTVASWP